MIILVLAFLSFSLISAAVTVAQKEDSTDKPAAAKAPDGNAVKYDKTEARLQAIKEATAPLDGRLEISREMELAEPTELESALFAMRDHLKTMRVLAIKYHLSDTPAQSKPLSRDWIKMLTKGRKLHQQLISAAAAEYKKEPKNDSQAADALFYVSLRCTHSDRYESMLDVVKLLDENKHPGEQMPLCMGLTAAAHGEFAMAKPHLELSRTHVEKAMQDLIDSKEVEKEERESVGKKMMELHGLLSELMAVEMYDPLWQDELKMREADAAGEPLPRVQIETTKGDFTVELFENEVPNTVANFIELCEKGFYDGLPFHRVLDHFMAQTGCPNRDGSGGPGYTIRTELDVPKRRNFFRGTLGMALSAQPDSGGSQFFVCYLPRAHLNANYVAFGRVIEGMEVLSDLTRINPDDKHDPSNSESLPDEITATKVLRKRAHEYKAQKISPPK